MNPLLFVFLVLFLASPGMASIFFNAIHEEKLLILYNILLGIFIHRYYNDETNTLKTKIILILLAFLINFSKEGGILSLCIMGILMTVKNIIEKRKDNFVGILFIALPVMTVLIWKLVIVKYSYSIYGNPHMSIAGYREYSLIATKFIVSDPIIFFLLIPMLVFRLRKLFQTKGITAADIMAYGGLGTLGVILMTQTQHASYYLMPIYGTIVWFFYQESKFLKT
jgi:hypothetical protein